MNCPFCGNDNIQGIDECEQCGEDLTAFAGVKHRDKLEKSLHKDSIESVHYDPVETVGPNASVREAAEKLAQSNRCVLVIDQGNLVGIVTERDILFKFMGTGRDPEGTPVTEIMTSRPDTLGPSDKLAFALNKMAIGGFRHIPLLKDGKPLGAISVRDILGYLAEMFPKVVQRPPPASH